ncbi:MAG: hypothetical protein AAF735_04825 [Myxococcota bacterium]
MVVTVTRVPLGGADNVLGARITVLDGDMVVGRYFVIANESRSHWRNVRVEIDGGYSVSEELVPSGSNLELFSTSFRREEMRRRRGRDIARMVRAPLDAPLTKIRVMTQDGEASAQIPKIGEEPSWNLF